VDFYVDLAVAVLLRLLKDKRKFPEYQADLLKVYNAIGNAMVLNHVQAVAPGDVKVK
jgi:hypothetical protein